MTTTGTLKSGQSKDQYDQRILHKTFIKKTNLQRTVSSREAPIEAILTDFLDEFFSGAMIEKAFIYLVGVFLVRCLLQHRVPLPLLHILNSLDLIIKL